MSAVYCLVLSQSTHVTDGQTDRIRTASTALHASHGKKQSKSLCSVLQTFVDFAGKGIQQN